MNKCKKKIISLIKQYYQIKFGQNLNSIVAKMSISLVNLHCHSMQFVAHRFHCWPIGIT